MNGHPTNRPMTKRFTLNAEASAFGMVWVLLDAREEHGRHESVFFDKDAGERICRKLNAQNDQINLTFS